MTEGTYDKAYVATHVVGFDKFSDYVLGKEDGVPKTAAWASPKCGVPEWTIKALAREWARKVTSTMHFYGGSYIRGPYAHEPARLECCLLGMQGLGKPGVHQYCRMGGGGIFDDYDLPRPVKPTTRKLTWDMWIGRKMFHLTPQILPKCLVHEAILNPPVSSWGSTLLTKDFNDQFIKYTYPIPKEKGGTEVHMIWMDNPCRTTCWNEGFLSLDAYRSPKIETIVIQHPWLENDIVFADIILPINTKLEEKDFGMQWYVPQAFKGITIEEQAIESVGESMSDYEAVGEVAKKLGLYEEYTGGKTVDEKIREGYEESGLADLVSWKEFEEKKYYIIPTDPNWKKYPAGLRPFYEDPKNNPLETPTGKLEFYSQRLADAFPDDEERGPLPKWIEKGVSHDERISSKRAKKYPLLLMSNHGRWRTHAQNDDITWTGKS